MPPMSAAMFDKAKQLIGSLSTEDPAAFKKRLAETSLEVLQEVGGGIEWWNITVPQKKEILGLVRAGGKQKECSDLLSDFTLKAAVDPGTSQPFVTAEFDRSGWFQYYYYEAAGVKNTLPEPRQRMLEEITNALFHKQSKSGPPGTYAQKTAYEDVPDATFMAILYELMDIGFERIPATCEKAIAGSASDAAIIGKMLWAGKAEDVAGTDIKVVKVEPKWRADSRKYSDIKAANGFLTKAHSDGYASYANLSAPWHPMSTDLGKRWLWFRKSQKDNCLYSVVSVGKAGAEWKTYLPYPLIKLSGGKVTGLRGYLGTRKVTCVPAKGGAPVDLDIPVSETYLYLFVLAGLALDTGAMQGKGDYPEIGVGEIPFKNVFGAVRFVRYHLGDEATVTDDSGVLAVQDGVERNDDNRLTIKASYGESLFTTLGERFDAAARLTAPAAVKWSPSGKGFVELTPYGHTFTHGGAEYRVASPLTTC